MHSTKTEILALLKRADGSTVDDLASSLGLASMTVRQHLTALERDTLVRAEGVRRATGRPHYLYRLTEEGHRQVSQGYDRIVALLVDQVGRFEAPDVEGRGQDERRRLLFERAASALAVAYRAEVAFIEGDRERIERVVEILRSYGGFPEWHEVDGGYEIRDFACVFRASAGPGGPCDWHETFLESILRSELRPATGDAGCAQCCRYVVTIGAPVTAHHRSAP